MYEIILYDTEDGRCPVQELLDSLEPKLLAKTLRTIVMLSRLVDTFFSRTSWTMLLYAENHSISVA